jgi:hypothetical protein
MSLTKSTHRTCQKGSSGGVGRSRRSSSSGSPLYRRALGDFLIRLLMLLRRRWSGPMRVREAPTAREIEVRARTATETLMALR